MHVYGRASVNHKLVIALTSVVTYIAFLWETVSMLIYERASVNMQVFGAINIWALNWLGGLCYMAYNILTFNKPQSTLSNVKAYVNRVRCLALGALRSLKCLRQLWIWQSVFYGRAFVNRYWSFCQNIYTLHCPLITNEIWYYGHLLWLSKYKYPFELVVALIILLHECIRTRVRIPMCVFQLQ